MRYPSLSALFDRQAAGFGKGPIALILAEDEVELDSTLAHHLACGFRDLVLLAPQDVQLSADQEPLVHLGQRQLAHDFRV